MSDNAEEIQDANGTTEENQTGVHDETEAEPPAETAEEAAADSGEQAEVTAPEGEAAEEPVADSGEQEEVDAPEGEAAEDPIADSGEQTEETAPEGETSDAKAEETVEGQDDNPAEEGDDKGPEQQEEGETAAEEGNADDNAEAEKQEADVTVEADETVEPENQDEGENAEKQEGKSKGDETEQADEKPEGEVTEQAVEKPEGETAEPETAADDENKERDEAPDVMEKQETEVAEGPTAPENTVVPSEAAPTEPIEKGPELTEIGDGEAPPPGVSEETQAGSPRAGSPQAEPDKGPEKEQEQGPPKKAFDPKATATVKFVLMPSGQVATMACTLGQTLSQLKEYFANELKMPSSVIMLMFEGKNMNSDTTLSDLGVGPNGTVQLEMQSSDPINTPIRMFRPRENYHMPDVINVRVQQDDGAFKDIAVEIERNTIKKNFFGGYRHKKTGVEYHHAAAQTAPKPKPPSNVERNCRETQTVNMKHRPQQTKNDTSTQMTKIGVFVPNVTDKLVIPGKYTTAEDHQDMLLKMVVIIQKYYRRWLAKRTVDKLKDDKLSRIEWERQEEIKKKKEKEMRIKKEFERRMNPKTKEDFDLLYNALEKWRMEELEHINNTLSGAERKAALCQLLEQETALIGSIGRHKLEADTENRQKHIVKFLEKAAAPKKWRGKDGKFTEMDTPYTIRAAELKDIYSSICMRYLTQDERLDVLLTLKHTVKEHDCKLTQEIIELIDREADLLMRGVKEENLEGLRKRISTLFLQYIKTPTFNPEVTRLLKVPQDPAQLRKNIYFCPSCSNYLPSTDFQLASNSRAVGICRKCNKMDNDARVRQDYSHYRFMLKTLRKTEEAIGDGSKIAFLMQETDLRYLVENVWNAASILSAWSDLYDLVLVRWDKREEWSPWNCILLTKEEASAHQKLENLDEGYGKIFIHRVDHKHTLAKNYFARLPGMAELMRESENKKQNQGPSVSGTRVPVQASA